LRELFFLREFAKQRLFEGKGGREGENRNGKLVYNQGERVVKLLRGLWLARDYAFPSIVSKDPKGMKVRREKPRSASWTPWVPLGEHVGQSQTWPALFGPEGNMSNVWQRYEKNLPIRRYGKNNVAARWNDSGKGKRAKSVHTRAGNEAKVQTRHPYGGFLGPRT